VQADAEQQLEPARISGFAPIVGTDPRILILGSMPSVASLEQQQYYGKARNAFWGIMGELFAAGPELDYAERTRKLAQAGVAVWDVLAACVRRGSLDSAIVAGSEELNDVAALLLRFPHIQHIFFNGGKAEQLFRQKILPQLAAPWTDCDLYTRLPSTSPAMAGLDFAGKLEQWQVVRAVLRGMPR
jgi:TDG/mug DNA glycosylase family protein